MSELYSLVNVYDKTKKWIGQFMDVDTAKAWIKKSGGKVDDYEISKRRPRPDRSSHDVQS